MAQLNGKLKTLVDNIFKTPRDYGYDCDACDREFAGLAERVAAGEALHEIFPDVADHFRRCNDCSEEFDALVAILAAENSGRLPTDGYVS